MNIDGPAREGLASAVGEDLHVASEDHQVNALFDHEVQEAFLLLGLIGWSHWHEVIRQAIAFSDRQAGLVIRHDADDVQGELASAPPIEQVQQAVIVLGNHDQGSTMIQLSPQMHGWLEAGHFCGHVGREFPEIIIRRLEARPCEEQASLQVGELLLLENIALSLQEGAADGMDDARGVRTGY